jgi:hypothetical protein
MAADEVPPPLPVRRQRGAGETPPRAGCGNGVAVACAAVGMVLLPMYGVLAVFRSDVCGPDSHAYYCSGAGQSLGMDVAVLCGPVAFFVLLVLALAVRPVRRFWGYAALGLQLMAFVVVSALSSMVS